MENIFKNAKFGDCFKTRDGRKAIYTIMSCGRHWLAVQDTSFTWEYKDNGELVSNIDNAMDIVSEWQEEIDEEKEHLKDQLDALNMHYLSQVSLWKSKYEEAIKKGVEWLRQCTTFQHPDYRHPVPFFDEEDIEDFKNFMKQ